MQFDVNSSMSVGGNSISFSFQMKQKWNMMMEAKDKAQVITSIEISTIYIKAKSFGLGSFYFLESVKTYTSYFPPLPLLGDGGQRINGHVGGK